MQKLIGYSLFLFLTAECIQVAKRVTGLSAAPARIAFTSQPDHQNHQDNSLSERSTRISELLNSPLGKIASGTGVLLVAGAASLRYARNRAHQMFLAKFDETGGGSLSNLLGPVLMRSEGKKTNIWKRLNRLRNHPYSPISNLIIGGPIGITDSLVSSSILDARKEGHTAVYVSGGDLEAYLQKAGYPSVTPRLIEAYLYAQEQNIPFEIVYVSMDHRPLTSLAHFDSMPWLAVPFGDRAKTRDIVKQLGIQSLPAVVIVDSQGNVVNSKAFNSIMLDPKGYPWPQKPINELIGSEFVTSEGSPFSADLNDQVIGLYFGAARSPACLRFEEQLKKTYRAANGITDSENNSNADRSTRPFEVLFISNDKSPQQFSEHFNASTPWLAIPHNDTARTTYLQDALDVRVLPTLVILDKMKNGKRKVITTAGVSQISRDPSAQNFPWTPPLVFELGESYEAVTDKPSVIAFLEGCDSQTLASFSNHLEAAALKRQSDSEDHVFPKIGDLRKNRKLNFIKISRKSKIGDALRTLCGVPPGTNRLVLMDLSEQQVYQAPSEDLDASNVAALISGYEEDTLAKKRINLAGAK